VGFKVIKEGSSFFVFSVNFSLRASWAQWAMIGLFLFGLQQQPQARDHTVISERKESAQVSPKVKLAIPFC
jgi:hypothetical protein